MERTLSTEERVEPQEGRILGLWMTTQRRNFHNSQMTSLVSWCHWHWGCFLHQFPGLTETVPWGEVLAECLGNSSTFWENGSLLGAGPDSYSELIKDAVGSLPGHEKYRAGKLARSASTYAKLNPVKWILWCSLRRTEKTSGSNTCPKLSVRVAFSIL